MSGHGCQFVTPRRAAILAGLLDPENEDPKALSCAMKSLGKTIAKWERRPGRPFEVRVNHKGKAILNVDGSALVKMFRVLADEERAAREGTVGATSTPKRARAKGGHPRLRTVTPEMRRAILRGEAI